MRLQCSEAAHGTKGLPETRILNMEPRLGTGNTSGIAAVCVLSL